MQGIILIHKSLERNFLENPSLASFVLGGLLSRFTHSSGNRSKKIMGKQTIEIINTY